MSCITGITKLSVLDDGVLGVIVGLGGASDRTVRDEERYGWYC